MNNSQFARTLLDRLREAANAETCAPWTDDDLIAARDYTLALAFPTGLAGAEQDMLVDQINRHPHIGPVAPGDYVKPALRRLHHKAQQDRNRQLRKAAKEEAGQEWDPDEDEDDEWAERIEKTRKTINEMIANARKGGRAVVATHDGMDGDTFRKSFKFVTADGPIPLCEREPEDGQPPVS